ncbi:hypothetical protein FRX31_009136, partial [Thalictrum thalictroides]
MDSQMKNAVVVKVMCQTGLRGQMTQVGVKFLDDQNCLITRNVRGLSEKVISSPFLSLKGKLKD